MGAGACVAGAAACDGWIQGMSPEASKTEAKLTIDFTAENRPVAVTGDNSTCINCTECKGDAASEIPASRTR